jgi:hypothetical protein
MNPFTALKNFSPFHLISLFFLYSTLLFSHFSYQPVIHFTSLFPSTNHSPAQITVRSVFFLRIYSLPVRSHWPRGLRHRSAAVRLLRLWVRFPPGAWMSVCCECCVLSGRGLCDELITLPEESYRLWYVVVCDLETSWIRKPWPTRGFWAKIKNILCLIRKSFTGETQTLSYCFRYEGSIKIEVMLYNLVPYHLTNDRKGK